MNRLAQFLCAAALVGAGPAFAAPHKDGAHMPPPPPRAGGPMRPGAPLGPVMNFPVIDAAGKTIGTAMLQDTPSGVLVSTDLKGVPAGEHGFHFHEKGMCDAAQKFTTAGAHFAPGKTQHGLLVTGGPHGGDMPNQFVGADGMLKAQVLNTGVTFAPGPRSLADVDGSALVIHAKPDDYKTQPSGDAGDRIACAVVAAPKK